MHLVTPQEMGEIDAETIRDYGLPSLVLMENAARSILAHLPPGPLQVLVGPGNNGGDGLVLARAAQEQGRDVRAWLLSETLSPDAETQRRLARAWGVDLRPAWEKDAPLLEPLPTHGVLVDALFGTGLSRVLEGRYALALEIANRSPAWKVAIDIPSGVDGRTGQILGCSLKADLTVTFGAPKWGHALFPGKERCGRLVVTQPGFHPESLARHTRVTWVTPDRAASLMPTLWPTMHKGDNGRLLLVTGSPAYPGAGVLSTLGALRGGAGLVTYAGPSEIHAPLTTVAPEALVRERDTLGDLSDFHAIVLGSGLGPDPEPLALAILERYTGPVVIDADALALVREFPLSHRRNWVLTPHPGELARLLEKPVSELEGDRIGWALQASTQLGAVVCFKGAPTVCATPDGRAYVNTTGNPLLAQGGSGDVLAGTIGAALSYGLPSDEAAAAAVYLHGLAADLLLAHGRGRGSGAQAVAEMLPEAFEQTVGKDFPGEVF